MITEMCDRGMASDHPRINQLPPEVLGLVFELCGNLTAEGYQSISHTRPPISLTHVCQLWNAVARSNPTLWTNIHVTWKTLESQNFPLLIDLHIKLSRLLPISAVISFDVEKDVHQIHRHQEIVSSMESIQRSFPRCKTLDFFASHTPTINTLFPANSTTSMPMLECFIIAQVFEVNLTCGRVDAPCLERLIVNAPFQLFDQVFTYSDRPSALKYLEFNYSTSSPSASYIFHVLHLSPHLAHLSISFVVMRGPFPTSIASLPCLHTLDINWETHPEQVQSFLHLLEIPSLQTLRLCSGDMTEIMFEPLFNLPGWSRALPQLKKIALSNLNLTSANFSSILSRCPTLEALDLAHCRGLADTVEYLTKPDRKMEGPFLQRLKMTSWDASALVEDQRIALLHMVTEDVLFGLLKDIHLDMPFYSLSQENELRSLCETQGIRVNTGSD